MSDDSTIVITDIHKVLSDSDADAQGRPACLLGAGGELNGAIFDLQEGENVIGRSADNTIVLEFAGISRKHTTVTISGENAFLNDLGSKNGTFLNNEKVTGTEATKLSKGDILKIGSVALKFLPKGDPERLTYDKLNYEANTDGLTKCFNKAYFNNTIELEVKKSKAMGRPLSLIIFDLDHFKKLNDNYGHDAGDFTLKELAEIVRKNGVRDDDIFARYGGEEFVVILPNTNLKQGVEVAERIRKLIEEHKFIYDSQELPVTASVGVADFRPGVETGVDLFKRVDTALYKSKDAGRNKVTFYKE